MMDKILLVNLPSALRADEFRFLYTIAQRISGCQPDKDKTFKSLSSEEIILVWTMTQGFRRVMLAEDGISFVQPSAKVGDHPDHAYSFLSSFDSPESSNYTSTPPIDFQNIVPWLMNIVTNLPPAMPKINIVFLDLDRVIPALDNNSRNKFWRVLKDFALGEPYKSSKLQRRWKKEELKIILAGENIDASLIEGFYQTESFSHLSDVEILDLIKKRTSAYTQFGIGKAEFVSDSSVVRSMAKEFRGLAEQEIIGLLDNSIIGKRIKQGKKESIQIQFKDNWAELVQSYKISKLKKLGVDLSPQPDSDIGGLDNLKKWVTTRESLFSESARKYNLPYPKGIMLIGPPGTGKSLIAKTIGNYWRVPVLSLDIGSIYGSLLGQSEQNLRNILATAKAIAPCILFIDELDKSLTTGGSAASDGGTSSRMFGNLLTWMSDKTEPVFVVATANNLSAILDNAPELLRKGRWDEIFYVDLPRKSERLEIFQIHAKKYNAKISDKLLRFLVESTEGNSAAEIASIVYTAVAEKFNDLIQQNKELPEIIELDDEYSLRNVLARHPKQKKMQLDPRLNCILANKGDID